MINFGPAYIRQVMSGQVKKKEGFLINVHYLTPYVKPGG